MPISSRVNSIGVAPQSLYTAQDSGKMSGFENKHFLPQCQLLPRSMSLDRPTRRTTILSNRSVCRSLKVIRGPIVTKGGKDIAPVIYLDPCAANDAAVSANAKVVPDNGFYNAAPFVGGFSATHNWLLGWTAADQFGMVDGSSHTAPSIDSIVKGGVGMTFFTEAGVWYKVQSSVDAGFTTPVDEATLLGNGTEMSWVDAAADPVKFFRVVFK